MKKLIIALSFVALSAAPASANGRSLLENLVVLEQTLIHHGAAPECTKIANTMVNLYRQSFKVTNLQIRSLYIQSLPLLNNTLQQKIANDVCYPVQNAGVSHY